MKIEQRQRRSAATEQPEPFTDSETNIVTDEEPFGGSGRPVLENRAEAELQKLFLARLDVRSRIEDLKRNRALLRARKVDVESKIAHLREFQAKLARREEELSRSLRG